MQKITSYNGIEIACYRQGEGQPLLLIHGTGSANPLAAWTAFTAAMAGQFELIGIDRRGRGLSGDSPQYSIQHEAEDIAAVIDSIGEPLSLFGHSYGGLCALEAALLTPHIHRLVLYEPPLPYPGSEPEYAVNQRLKELLDANDRDGILTTFYLEIAGLSAKALAEFRASPAWLNRLEAAHTIVREGVAEENYQYEPARFQQLTVPTLLLLGSESPAYFREVIHLLQAALPNNQLFSLAGEGHLAMYTAPDLLVAAIVPFLRATHTE